jgi:hypothetical protein
MHMVSAGADSVAAVSPAVADKPDRSGIGLGQIETVVEGLDGGPALL